jgi:spectinomycin phosphotransferase
MREQPNIPKEHLRACLQEQYALSVVTLEFLPLGLDMRAGVYRVVSEEGAAYLLKAKYGALYEPGCLVPRYLRDQEIAAVVAPLPTKKEDLWSELGEWRVIVYPFIEGHTRWNPAMTDAQWRAVGTTLKQIHEVIVPAERWPLLRAEAFDPTGYSRSVALLETQYIRAEGGSQAEQALRACWLEQQETIHAAVASLEALAERLRERAGQQVICHADLHPGNIIRNQADQIFVIDWDDVMLAPKERDFLFVGEAPATGAALHDAAPFFQGYGQTEVDWTALTYYRWERVIQDVIAFGEEVFLRDDLEEATRAESVRYFQGMFAADSMVTAARAAAQRAGDS